MSSKQEKRVTDQESLSNTAYRDTSLIEKRQALYKHTSPRFSVDDEALSLIQGFEGMRLLDAGCGAGNFLMKALQKYKTGTFDGIDIAEGMFSKRREQAIDGHLPVTFRTGDIQALPFPDHTFDRVVAMHMLYHVPDITKALSEIARVVKPQGMALFSANSIESKPILGQIKTVVARALGHEFPDVTGRFNIENGIAFISEKFQNVQVKRFISTLILSDPQPYVDYFDSTREFWQPAMDDSEWKHALSIARAYIMDVMEKNNGMLSEENIFGIITAQPRYTASQN